MIGLGVQLQLSTQSVAIHLGHHYIAHNDVGGTTINLGKCLAAVGTTVDVVVRAQLFFKKITYLIIVFGDDDDFLSAEGVFQRLFYREGVFRVFQLGHRTDGFFFLTFHHLLWFQVTVAKRYANGEQHTTLEIFKILRTVGGSEVASLDVAIVKLHQ